MKAEQFSLNNGLSVGLIQYPGANSVHINLGITAGSRDELRPQAGSAHLLEHLISRNIEKSRSSDSWLDNYFRSGFSANTTAERTHFETEIHKSELEQTLPSLASAYRLEGISEEDFSAEKNITIEEILEDDDGFNEFVRTKYYGADHPLSNPASGTLESIKGLNFNQVEEFHRQFYIPEKTAIVFSGDLTSENLKKTLEKLFGTGRTEAPATPYVRLNSSYSGLYKKELEDSQFRYSRIQRVENVSAEGQARLRLYQGIIEAYIYRLLRSRGLLYRVDVSLNVFREFCDFEIDLAMQPPKAGEVVKAIEDGLNDFTISADEFKAAKIYRTKLMEVYADDMEYAVFSLSRNMLTFGEFFTFADEKSVIRSMELDDLLEIHQHVLKTEPAVFIGGDQGIIEDFS